MDKELIKKWVAALRSGEYKQVRSCLVSTEGFCCLGVLCAIKAADSSPEGVERAARYGSRGHDYGYTNGSLYNEELIMLTGLDRRAIDADGQQSALRYVLMGMNDQEKKTFPEIADYIEKELLSDDTTGA